MSYKPGISVAMIAKNEERCIGRCLASMKGWVDEIVLIDTGSTDRTIEIAQNFGAKIRQIEWPGDFSSARNESLKDVTHEWTLWMDADEWFPPDTGPMLRMAIESKEALGYSLIRCNLREGSQASTQILLRLWRSHPSLAFQGIIHEFIDMDAFEEAFPGKKFYASTVKILHDGFAGRAREKAERNLPYLEAELSARPGQIYFECERALTLDDLGDSRAEEALLQFRDRIFEFADQDKPPTVAIQMGLIRLLGRIPDGDLRTPETDMLLRLTRGWFPKAPVLLTLVGQVEIRRNDLRGAFSVLSDAAKIVESGESAATEAYDSLVLDRQLPTNLALVAHQLGNKPVARYFYEKLLKADPNNPVALQNLKLL